MCALSRFLGAHWRPSLYNAIYSKKHTNLHTSASALGLKDQNEQLMQQSFIISTHAHTTLLYRWNMRNLTRLLRLFERGLTWAHTKGWATRPTAWPGAHLETRAPAESNQGWFSRLGSMAHSAMWMGELTDNSFEPTANARGEREMGPRAVGGVISSPVLNMGAKVSGV